MVKVLFDNREKLGAGFLKLIKAAARAAYKALGYTAPAEVSVVICDRAAIKKLNSDFREINEETDVLSFPMLDFEGGKPKFTEGVNILGDIVISLPRAARQAKDYGHSLEREIAFLTVHSMLHLLGFDHDDEAGTKEMRRLEREILYEMGLGRDEE